MTQKRKGSRTINVNGVEYSWFRGKSVTEIRNLETRKTKRIPNEQLDKSVDIVVHCDCCNEPVYHDGILVTHPGVSTTPSAIREYILEQF